MRKWIQGFNNLNLFPSFEEDEKVISSVLSKHIFDNKENNDFIERLVDTTLWLSFFGVSLERLERFKNINGYEKISVFLKKETSNNTKINKDIYEAISDFLTWLQSKEAFDFKQVLLFIALSEKKCLKSINIQSFINATFRNIQKYLKFNFSFNELDKMLNNLNEIDYISFNEKNDIIVENKIKYASLFNNPEVSPKTQITLIKKFKEGNLTIRDVENVLEEFSLNIEENHKLLTKLGYLSKNFTDNQNNIPSRDDKNKTKIKLFESQMMMSDMDREIIIKLKETIKTTKEVFKIFRQYNKVNYFDYLEFLGFYEKNGFIIQKKFSSVNEAIKEYLYENEIFRKSFSAIDQSAIMNKTIVNMERKSEIFLIDTNTYVTINYLEKKGITKDMINKMLFDINVFLQEEKYFSIKYLIKGNFQNKLFNLGFREIFYERILLTSIKFNPINGNSPYLFSKRKTSSIKMEEFLVDKYEFEGSSIRLGDFLFNIEKEYGVILNEYRVVNLLEKYGVYYSPEMNKLFDSKKDYFREVYE